MARLLELAAGSVFAGEFRVVRPLAEGGMGAVYEVQQIATGAPRALKIMHPALLTDATLRVRFAQEARVSLLIESDHVVQVVGAGIDASSETPWIAMELLRGETLASFMSHRGALTHDELREVFAQLCHAVAAAHDVGVVHRDLKPENIFLSVPRREGIPFTVKVLDFGIAKLVAEAHTQHTAAVGTPLWMAPEQTETGLPVRPGTDVWALGLLAFHALTQRHFWKIANAERLSAAALLREVVLDPLPTASERAEALGVKDKLPEGFDAWFGRCVVREMERRFPNARAAREALEAILPPPSTSVRLHTHPQLIVPAPSSGNAISVPPPTNPGDPASDATAPAPSVSKLAVSAAPLEGDVPIPIKADTRPAPSAPTHSAAGGRTSPGDTNEPVAADGDLDVPTRGPPVGKIAAIGAFALVVVVVVSQLVKSSGPEVASATPAPSTSVSARPSNTFDLGAGAKVAACPPGMATIGGGTFFYAEKGDHVTIAPFCLDVTEVTVSAYAECVKKGGCNDAELTSAPACNWSNKASKERHPINCVDWDQANAYCTSVGKRLPKMEEWTWAARGGEAGTTFPWGEDPPNDRVCWSGGLKRIGTCEVKGYPTAASPHGVHDLAGNVAEWVAADPRAHDSIRPLLGDSWASTATTFAKDTSGRTSIETRLAARRLHEATIGFRCAKDP